MTKTIKTQYEILLVPTETSADTVEASYKVRICDQTLNGAKQHAAALAYAYLGKTAIISDQSGNSWSTTKGTLPKFVKFDTNRYKYRKHPEMNLAKKPKTHSAIQTL